MKKIYKLLIFLICLIMAGSLNFIAHIDCLADYAVVKEDGVRVRSEAATSGAVVDTGTLGQKFEIVEVVTGSDGQTWYKVNANGQTGYLRGDLVKVEETAETATSQATTQVVAMVETQAKIKGVAAVNVRSGAGSSFKAVAFLDPNTVIVLIGQAKDSAGNTWYQIKCESENIEGFVRQDLIEITQISEGNPKVTYIEPEQIATDLYASDQNNDYEIVYAEDIDGTYAYYLYDYTQSQRIKVTDIYEALGDYANIKPKYDGLIDNNNYLNSQVTALGEKVNELEDANRFLKILSLVIPICLLVIEAVLLFVFVKKGKRRNKGIKDKD